MNIIWGSFITFICVAHFTPGPNNLNSAAMGMDGGYKCALPFVVGVYFGLSILLSLVGFLKLAVSDFFYRNILIFRIAGSAYLLWPAFSMTLKALFLTGTYCWYQVVAISFTLPVITFFTVSTWALAGVFLSWYLEKPTHRRIFFWVIALLLVYTVIIILTKEFV